MNDDRNLTLRVDAQVLLWARMRALRDGTSINRRIRAYLEEYAAIPPDQRWPRTPSWPDADPGEAGVPGTPLDHADLRGRDGYRISTLPGAVIRAEIRQEQRARRRARLSGHGRSRLDVGRNDDSRLGRGCTGPCGCLTGGLFDEEDGRRQGSWWRRWGWAMPRWCCFWGDCIPRRDLTC